MKSTASKAGMSGVLFGLVGGFAAQFLQSKLSGVVPGKIESFVGAGAGLVLVLTGATKKPMINGLAIGMAGQSGAQLTSMLGLSGPGSFSDEDLGLNAPLDETPIVFLNPGQNMEALNAAADFSASVSAAADFSASVSGSYDAQENSLF
jgi:hypothetical protein